MEGMFVSLSTALDIKLCLITNGHLCMFNQALYPMEHTKWCIYALFVNDKNQIKRNCFLKTLKQTTNLAYSLDGYLWAISALATEKLQARCVMQTHVITIKPPLQIVDIGNGCEAYSASIFIPAKSELMAVLQSVTRSQFFLEYNINYTNVSNVLVWYKSDFTKLTNKEIETLKAEVLKLPTMSMEIFDNVLENIDENYLFSLSPKLILASLITVDICVGTIGNIFIWHKRKASLTTSMVGNLVKLIPSKNEKTPTVNSLLPILPELTSSQNNENENVITPVTFSTLSQTPPDELILPPVLVPQFQMDAKKPPTTTNVPFQLDSSLKFKTTDMKLGHYHWIMFNHAATDLGEKGEINLKKYSKYLYRKSKPI